MVSDESDSSDLDFQPNEESIISNPVLTGRWFKSLSKGRVFKVLALVFPHMDPC